jgi:hypothetical protein
MILNWKKRPNTQIGYSQLKEWMFSTADGIFFIPQMLEKETGINCSNVSTVKKLTPWSRVLPEKLKGHQLVKKFPAFFGTGRFITAITSARHLSQSRARSIQSMPHHPTS